jgi:hypothetical protein
MVDNEQETAGISQSQHVLRLHALSYSERG